MYIRQLLIVTSIVFNKILSAIIVYFITSLALTNYSSLSITLCNISPIVINIIDIKTLPITIGAVYTNLINLD